MIRQLGYWLGAAWDLIRRACPRLTWRRWQTLRRWAINLRDVAAVLVAIVLWAAALYLGAA